MVPQDLKKPNVGIRIPIPEYNSIKRGRAKDGGRIIYLIPRGHGAWGIAKRGSNLPGLVCFVHGSLLNGGELEIKCIERNCAKGRVVGSQTRTMPTY